MTGDFTVMVTSLNDVLSLNYGSSRRGVQPFLEGRGKQGRRRFKNNQEKVRVRCRCYNGLVAYLTCERWRKGWGASPCPDALNEGAGSSEPLSLFIPCPTSPPTTTTPGSLLRVDRGQVRHLLYDVGAIPDDVAQ